MAPFTRRCESKRALLLRQVARPVTNGSHSGTEEENLFAALAHRSVDILVPRTISQVANHYARMLFRQIMPAVEGRRSPQHSIVLLFISVTRLLHNTPKMKRRSMCVASDFDGIGMKFILSSPQRSDSYCILENTSKLACVRVDLVSSA